jgi:hypothetical protein
MNRTLLFLLLFISSFAMAEQDVEEDTMTSNEQQAETATTTSSTPATVKTPDSFDPTETLSQDVPAAFPVDI